MLKKELDTVKIDGLGLVSTSKKRLLEFLTSRIAQSRKTFVVTPNPEFFVFARHNPWFEAILEKADLAIPDGAGLIWASRFLAFSPLVTLSSLMENLPSRFARSCPLNSLIKVTSRPVIKERISGTDLMEKLCGKAAKKGWSVYLLGGKPGVADAAAAKLKIKSRNFGAKLKIWAESGPELELVTDHWSPITKKKIAKIIQEINLRKPDFLFVALGMGKQEKFIYDNWDKLNVKLAMGVGGAFDYISGLTPRAPKWVRKIGLEWFYRLIREPWRWRRQLALGKFILLVLRERFFSQDLIKKR